MLVVANIIRVVLHPFVFPHGQPIGPTDIRGNAGGGVGEGGWLTDSALRWGRGLGGWGHEEEEDL